MLGFDLLCGSAVGIIRCVALGRHSGNMWRMMPDNAGRRRMRLGGSQGRGLGRGKICGWSILVLHRPRSVGEESHRHREGGRSSGLVGFERSRLSREWEQLLGGSGLPSEEVFEAQVVLNSPETRVQARMQSL
jgi:hypothetical protein